MNSIIPIREKMEKGLMGDPVIVPKKFQISILRGRLSLSNVTPLNVTPHDILRFVKCPRNKSFPFLRQIQLYTSFWKKSVKKLPIKSYFQQNLNFHDCHLVCD